MPVARDTNRMTEAVNRLVTRFTTYASVTVTYTRGEFSVTLTATVGRTPYDIEQGGAVVAYESRDYIIKAEDLVLDDEVVKPSRGDRITDGSKTYEVNVPGNMNVFESIGSDGSVLKIHTKAV